jgi:hypothetical protein
MQLAARGLPLHTRTLSVTLSAADSGAVAFDAYVLDLRKRGFVPVAGDLQGTGIIHHMQLGGTLDPATRTIARIAARMPTVAFEASEASQGESCRDLVGRVDHLAGTPLDASWARSLGAEIGGPRGCSHVLTLAQLLGPTATWALDEDQRLLGSPRRPIGERIFRRDVTVDGYELDGGLYLTLQMNDLYFAPLAPGGTAGDRFAAQVEIRASAHMTMPDMNVVEVTLGERRRSAKDFETAVWLERAEHAAALVGASLRSGISARLLGQFADAPGDRPLLDALLMLAPATVQCLASFIDTWTQVPWMRQGGGSETGGYPDSCWMWRRDGALGRKRFG